MPEIKTDIENLTVECVRHPGEYLDYEIMDDNRIRVEPCLKCMAESEAEGEMNHINERRSREEHQHQMNEANNWILQLSHVHY